MKTLDSFDFGSQSSRGQYDWDSILDGDIHVFVEEKDYTCKTSTFISRARAVASKRGLSLKTAKDKDGNVVMQAYKKTPSAFEKVAGKEETKEEETKEETPKKRRRRSS